MNIFDWMQDERKPHFSGITFGNGKIKMRCESGSTKS